LDENHPHKKTNKGREKLEKTLFLKDHLILPQSFCVSSSNVRGLFIGIK
jgi:hypothetical protein